MSDDIEGEGFDASFDAGTNVLVRAPGMGSTRAEACVDLLAAAPTDRPGVLAVTLRESPAACADRFVERLGDPPAAYRAVAPNDERVDAPFEVEYVDAPDDLTGLEIAVTDALSSFDGDRRTTVCFDSVTALLQYAGLERSYRFLHAMTERLWRADAVGHFHVDPSAHDERTLATLTAVFDAVVDFGGDDRRVRRRPLVGTDKD